MYNNNAMSGRGLEDFTKIDKIGEGFVIFQIKMSNI